MKKEAYLLILKSSLLNDFCSKKTSKLDGETALKPSETILCTQQKLKKG